MMPATPVDSEPFQPAPYEPLANTPTESKPNIPQTPCTLIAPQGSSMRNRSSTKMVDSITNTAAIEPITAAAHGATNAHGAVIATRPANIPLIIIPGFGLPVRRVIQNIEATAPNAPEIAVFVATVANCTSVAESVDAALKPNQPNRRIKVPSIAIGKWCPGIGRDFPSLEYLPMRGPSTIAPASAATPPVMCTTPDPAKST